MKKKKCFRGIVVIVIILFGLCLTAETKLHFYVVVMVV